jgi:nucleotide-binding universal stress UspA family protein
VIIVKGMVISTIISVRQILVPVDGSPASEKALAYGIHLAKLENARLSMVHVIDDIKMGGAIGLQAKYGNVKLVEGYNKARKEWALQWMMPYEEAARNDQVKADSEILYDIGKSEAGMIIDYAKENGIDIIVMGTRGRSKFKRLVIGSVASKVFHHAHCPVLVVR